MKKGRASTYRMERVHAAYTELQSFHADCKRPDSSGVYTLEGSGVEQAPPQPAGEESSAATVVVARSLGVVADSISASLDRAAASDFLLRCAFTMFLSGLNVIPPRALSCAIAMGALAAAWAAMVHTLDLPKAGIFASVAVPELDESARRALIEADASDWGAVDLSILGGLVESSFDAKTRHQLGAHYTPRSYVMRLVGPTIEEPLRADWAGTVTKSTEDVLAFHAKLCSTRVLDPACGAGNFLIVALETLYGIEDDVLRELGARGVERPAKRVGPRQMHGIDIDPRACVVCRLVLQMCHLRRTHSGGA